MINDFTAVAAAPNFRFFGNTEIGPEVPLERLRRGAVVRKSSVTRFGLAVGVRFGLRPRGLDQELPSRPIGRITPSNWPHWRGQDVGCLRVWTFDIGKSTGDGYVEAVECLARLAR